MRTAAPVAVAGLLAACSASAPPPPAAPGADAPPSRPIRLEATSHTLRNGLRVVLSEDHTAPTVSICVTYDAGSRDEKPGRTGFAHLFEHMMFQGSVNVGKGEHFILVQNNGGNMNGTTSPDRTNYFQTLPANQLDLALFLEADRMASLAVTAANFENQRNAVREERRLNYDNQPYGRTYEALLNTVYDNFAYKHSTIGSMADLDAALLGDVKAFYETYYAPNNAVLALVGDFRSEDALARIRSRFEAIPARPDPEPPDMTEPEQTSERRRTLEDGFAQAPRIDIVWKIPPANTPDWYALSVLGDILAENDSSRLYQALVKRSRLAVSVGGGAHERRGPSLFGLVVMARPDSDLDAIESAAWTEIDRLREKQVEAWELEKVRRQLRRQLAQHLQGTLARAIQLSQSAVFYDDPLHVNTLESRVAAVTAEDIRRVARQYLVPSNRTVLRTVPAKKDAAK
jgi:predicted Zn-dependent peptidase